MIKRKLKEKRDILKRENLTYLMDQHKKKEIPTVQPIALINEKTFKNNSEKARCERYSQKLLNLKEFIDNDEYNEKLYMKEVRFELKLVSYQKLYI